MSFYQRSQKSPSGPKWNKAVCNEYEFLRGKQALNVTPRDLRDGVGVAERVAQLITT